MNALEGTNRSFVSTEQASFYCAPLHFSYFMELIRIKMLSPILLALLIAKRNHKLQQKILDQYLKLQLSLMVPQDVLIIHTLIKTLSNAWHRYVQNIGISVYKVTALNLKHAMSIIISMQMEELARSKHVLIINIFKLMVIVIKLIVTLDMSQYQEDDHVKLFAQITSIRAVISNNVYKIHVQLTSTLTQMDDANKYPAVLVRQSMN